MNLLLCIYMFTCTWTSFFAFGYFSIPNFSVISYLFFSIINNKVKLEPKLINSIFGAFIICIFWYSLTSLFNQHEKSINFLFAYTFIPFLLCYLPFCIKLTEKQEKKLIRFFFNGLLFVAIYCMFEAFIRNVLGIVISDFLPFSKENLSGTWTSKLKDDLVFRSRGFATEPIICGLSMSFGVAFVFTRLEKLFSLGFSDNKREIKLSFLYLVVFSISLFLTGSTAALVALIFFLFLKFSTILFELLGSIRFMKIKKSSISRTFIILMPIISILIFTLFFSTYTNFIEKSITKLSLSNSRSVLARTEQIEYYFSNFVESPLGLKGSLGNLSKDGSAFNWYITLLGDIGLIGTILTLIPMGITIYNAFIFKTNNLISKSNKLLLFVIPLIGLFFHGTFYASIFWQAAIFIKYL